MITLEQYVGPYRASSDWTIERQLNAQKLLAACFLLSGFMEEDGIAFPINPATKTQVSGRSNGGFRPQACPIGAPKSNHKQGLAVDWYDPNEQIDNWCMNHHDVLQACGIWLEHPDATPGWSHWQNVAPRSGNRLFYP